MEALIFPHIIAHAGLKEYQSDIVYIDSKSNILHLVVQWSAGHFCCNWC